jgi:hypothetical protein
MNTEKEQLDYLLAMHEANVAAIEKRRALLQAAILDNRHLPLPKAEKLRSPLELEPKSLAGLPLWARGNHHG